MEVYEFFMRHQSLIRENVNGATSVTCLVLAAVVALFMIESRNEGGDWRHLPGVPTACALFWVFTAEWYRTASIWWLYRNPATRHIASLNDNAIGMGWSLGYSISGILLIMGLLRAVYMFTPPLFQESLWRITFIYIVMFLIGSHALKLLGH